MYNQDALKLSEENLQGQYNFILERYPFIREIHPIDNINNMRADYLAGIDAIGICGDGETRSIQLKSRKPGNRDLIIPAVKLSGKAALEGDIGFMYDGEKYAFNLKADIFVENISGNNYSFTKEELMAAEALYPRDLQNGINAIRHKYLYDDKGNSFPAGDYYVFIDPDKMLSLQTVLFNIMHGKEE